MINSNMRMVHWYANECVQYYPMNYDFIFIVFLEPSYEDIPEIVRIPI